MNYATLAWANLTRKPLRTSLTGLCLVVSFLLFGLLQPISELFTEGPAQSALSRLVVTPKHSSSDLLPVHYTDKILAVDDVSTVSHMTWFGGTYIDTENFFPQFAVSRTEHLQVFPEIELPAEQRNAFLNNRQGAIVGVEIAQKYGWAIGDIVPIVPNIWHNREGKAWEFEVVGIFTSSNPGLIDNSGFYFGYNYFDDYRAFGNGTVGSFAVSGAAAATLPKVGKTIDGLFANSPSETKTMTEREYALSFARQMGDVSLIVNVILAAVLFTMIMVTGNTMAEAARERIPEMAVMKVLGFGPFALVSLTLLEAFTLVLIAGLIGLLCAQLILTNITGWIPDLAQLGDLKISLTVALQGLAIALGIGLFVSLPPAIRLLRISILDALRV